MPSIKFDLAYIFAGIESLENFLVSKHLFWPINRASPYGEANFPRLTVGGLLLSKARIESQKLNLSESHQFDVLKMDLNSIRTKRINAWERKVKKEFQSRLRQWQQYMSELTLDPQNFIAYYASEVRLRTQISLLGTDTQSCYDCVSDEVEKFDLILRSVFQEGKFIWDDDIRTGFNVNEFWFLWGTPVLEKFNIK